MVETMRPVDLVVAMMGDVPGEIGWALAGITWIAVGYAVFWAAHRVVQPSRVR